MLAHFGRTKWQSRQVPPFILQAVCQSVHYSAWPRPHLEGNPDLRRTRHISGRRAAVWTRSMYRGAV